jgi:hypothetical protein
MLLTEVQERAKQIDSKSAIVFGWATAIMAFLFTQMHRSDALVIIVIGFLSAFLSVIAAVFAYLALRTRDEWLWPSDKDWFERSAFGCEDELKRFHIRAMHEARHAQLKATKAKTEHLSISETFLVFSAVVLAGGVALRLLAALFPISLVALGH